MPQITLRPYQQTIVDDIRSAMRKGCKRTLAVAPTGGGKTVMFSYVTQSALDKGGSILILAHRTELLDQTNNTLKMFGVNASFIAADKPFNPANKVQLGSVMTVKNRLKRMQKPSLIIVDEAHHYRKHSTYDQILTYFDTYTIGLTATPCRLSGEALGDYFKEMILGPSVRELIDLGYLCDYDLYAPAGSGSIDFSDARMTHGDFNMADMEEALDRPSITGDAIIEYQKHCDQKQAVAFCTSVRHASNVAGAFRDRGIPAMSIDGKMPAVERANIISAFRRGEIKVMTNCQIVTEGFDLPQLYGVIQLRPTASLSLYMQMVGRGLRIFEGKDRAIILDHVGNYERHGLPCDDRVWSLEGKIKSKKKNNNEIKICENCFIAMPSNQRVCRNCGHVNAKVGGGGREDIEEIDGDLEKIDKKKIQTKSRQEQGMAQSFDELVDLAKKKGFKHPYGWAKHVVMARQVKKLKG